MMGKWFYGITSLAAIAVAIIIYILARGTSDSTLGSVLSGMIGAILGMVVTIWLVRVAHVQLTGISNTNDATFVFSLKRDFFTEETRRIIQLLDMALLKFVDNENLSDSYFTIDEKIVRNSKLAPNLKKWLLSKKAYSTYEIDDFLLGYMEDLGMLVQEKIVRTDLAYEEFSYYVEVAWEDCGIQEYIRRQRKEASDIYDKLEALYKAFAIYEDKKGVTKGTRT